MHVLTVDYTAPNAPELFCKSLKETGFGVLSHHPISPQLIDRAYQQWQDFFNTDIAHRQQYLHQKPSQDGYFPFRTENAKNSKISDLKEFFHYYPWGKIPVETKEATIEIYEALSLLAAELLQWIEDHLPDHVAKSLSMPLREMIVNSPNTLLRILHYPPLAADAEKEAVRAAAHEDINLITLLPSATAPGLEVLDTHGKWHAITCNPGNIAVNVGDMLQMCTQHYFKSTTHRVINPTGKAAREPRFSMPLFLHARKEVRLSDQYTASEYLTERLREIGIY